MIGLKRTTTVAFLSATVFRSQSRALWSRTRLIRWWGGDPWLLRRPVECASRCVSYPRALAIAESWVRAHNGYFLDAPDSCHFQHELLDVFPPCVL